MGLTNHTTLKILFRIPLSKSFFDWLDLPLMVKCAHSKKLPIPKDTSGEAKVVSRLLTIESIVKLETKM